MTDTKQPDTPYDGTKARSALMYNHYLGGKSALPADREAAQVVINRAPDTPAVARENLLFAGRGAAWAVRRYGLDQVLDIGAGIVDDNPLPTVEVAVREADPQAKVVTFDNDHVVLAHARALRSGYRGVLYGDATDLDSIFGHPELGSLIDLRKPMVVVLAAVLHFVRDPAGVVAELGQRLPSGSVLVLSHACSTGLQQEAVRDMTRAYDQARSELFFRTEEEIRALAGPSWALVDPPGLVDVARWDLPEPRTQGHVGETVRVLGMVAVLGRQAP